MQKPVEKPIKFIKNAATKGKSYPVAHIESIIDSSGKTLPEILKESGGVTETTYADLKSLRDNGKLSPGSLYRITDVTNAFSPDSPYYGKQVDVIVMATDNSTLSEEGWAAMHLTEPYTVTFVGDNVTKKMYIYREDNHIWYVETDTLQGGDMADLAADYGLEYDELVTVDEDNKTVSVAGNYNYFASNFYDENAKYNDFQDTNFGEWKIWYCLDNDKSRFAWADDRLILHQIMSLGPSSDYIRTPEGDSTIDGVKYYAWVWIHSQGGTTKYTLSETPKHGDALYQNFGGMVKTGEVDKVFTNGRGVIYKTQEEVPQEGNLTKVTWQELKDKRDTGSLIPGSLYRITDYNCTTTQENTRSAGHQFDIVLLALSENKLAEGGWAMEHPTDVYDVTFSDGVTKKCYLYFTTSEREGEDGYNIVDIETLLGNFWGEGALNINEEQKTASFVNEVLVSYLNQENLTYNYFQNSNLSAWKVWYCLDNDTARFVWATTPSSAVYSLTVNLGGNVISCTATRDESRDSGEFKCFVLSMTGSDQTPGWIKSETLSVGTVTIYTEPSEDAQNMEFVITSATELPPVKATGVIYRLIDEWGNDCPYDFKNIQYQRTTAMSLEEWLYTFTAYDKTTNVVKDASMLQNTCNPIAYEMDSEHIYRDMHYCCNNVIKPYFKYDGNGLIKTFNKYNLNSIYIVLTYSSEHYDSQTRMYDNFFENDCHDISIGCDDLTDSSFDYITACVNYFEQCCHSINCSSILYCRFERLSTSLNRLTTNNTTYYNSNIGNRVAL